MYWIVCKFLKSMVQSRSHKPSFTYKDQDAPCQRPKIVDDAAQ